jgi:hypothetical protein
MTTRNRLWLRTAATLHAELLRPKQKGVPSLPGELWKRTVNVAHRMELAADRSWQSAAKRQMALLLENVEELQSSLSKIADQLRQRLEPQVLASEADLYRDLAALDREFESLECDLDSESISVTTSPIVLENIELGRFQIRLELGQFPTAQKYAVVALEPNPANSDSSITHPHVNDESLCEGDGRKAIESALTAGRLYDFFTIVNQLLRTYAEGRAYVELSNWYGVPCHDCNSTVDEDERYYCHRCEETLCSDCASHCSHCDETCCSNCSSSCPRCDGLVCVGCLQTCRECRNDVCPDCINHNLCTQCQNHEPEPDEVYTENQEEPPAVPAKATIQPDCLGEAPVLA